MANMTYTGEYLDDMRHGSGVLTSESQTSVSYPDYVYDGQWVLDQREGHGQLVTKHDKYSGEFRADKFHGYGVYCGEDGTVYAGDWYKGNRHGTAEMTKRNGDKFTGEFHQNQKSGIVSNAALMFFRLKKS